jgi:hypothetical protein
MGVDCAMIRGDFFCMSARASSTVAIHSLPFAATGISVSSTLPRTSMINDAIAESSVERAVQSVGR